MLNKEPNVPKKIGSAIGNPFRTLMPALVALSGVMNPMPNLSLPVLPSTGNFSSPVVDCAEPLTLPSIGAVAPPPTGANAVGPTLHVSVALTHRSQGEGDRPCGQYDGRKPTAADAL